MRRQFKKWPEVSDEEKLKVIKDNLFTDKGKRLTPIKDIVQSFYKIGVTVNEGTLASYIRRNRDIQNLIPKELSRIENRWISGKTKLLS